MGRVMAVDYGDARTGIALSDLLGCITGKSFVISSWNEEEVLQKIKETVLEENVSEIVLGFPRNMDGSEGARAEKYKEFGNKISEKTGLKVVLWDERRTTIEAHQILSRNGKKMKDHKKNVDALAASLMLEGYLRQSAGSL